MAKEKTGPKGPTARAQTGADLRAWRRAVGLYVKEIAELIGVSVRAVERAERSAQPTGKVLRGVERLQARLLAGKLHLGPLLHRRRVARPAPETRNTTKTRHSPRKMPGKNATPG